MDRKALLGYIDGTLPSEEMQNFKQLLSKNKLYKEAIEGLKTLKSRLGSNATLEEYLDNIVDDINSKASEKE